MSGGAGLSTRVLPHVDFLDRYIKEQDSDQLLKILIFQIKFSLSLQLTILRHMHIFCTPCATSEWRYFIIFKVEGKEQKIFHDLLFSDNVVILGGFVDAVAVKVLTTLLA